ncbi:MBL fold metallo-hydrolase [Tessaracoccus flavus]|jgi:glyoxylase-like metal-dependent hydrolase (beta-lactamase superfamily II)/rhodanese-related sulfurtransferase|uniref:MBL fold metallo-hydrolase n=1 Tax=Tessaracoccus flavus TaxID=1610493 RepID=A0A1Q2CCV4_9ACTN|nr:rhodanese-like domain-containing protein [Tessaracoccus flavus]AQP43927.1 MBL fold metallo-hydrolase [Tessaracoccus flavus]SDY28935.1 Glyoxylase, beta-lactamase superfamily II [Tessaracoccus flavus]
MPTIHTIETKSLGDRSYLVHDGDVAFVIDPQRDIERVLKLATDEGVRIEAIFETHIHNDYVTGGYALAQQVGAKYYVNGDDDVSFERTPIADKDVIDVGSMKVQALLTPGHTFTHLSYALLDDAEPVVFTGGSLLYGATGRPDLLGKEHAEALARHQHASAHRLASELPDETQIMPTHGFGSFCSATPTTGDSSTIGLEKKQNPALTQGEEEYVEALLAGLDVFPAYYAHMGPANASGPDASDLSPVHRADKQELRARLEAGEWLVDLRTRTAFAAGHAPGTYNIGLDGQFSTYLGWLIPWGTPVTLLGESEEQVAEAQREMTLIGIDRAAASATGGPSDWTDDELGTLTRATFADLAQVKHHREVVILDTRRKQEWDESHIEGAVHIPLHDILKRMDEVPDGELWVHCAGGYRASIASSILQAAGKTVVHVDDSFDEQARAAGLTLV